MRIVLACFAFLLSLALLGFVAYAWGPVIARKGVIEAVDELLSSRSNTMRTAGLLFFGTVFFGCGVMAGRN